MYYKFDCDFPMTQDNTYFDIDDGIEIEGVASWARGISFAASLPHPIVIPITRIGDDPDPGLIPIPFNDQNLCIACPEVLHAILGCGVNNLQCYPAVLKDTDSGQEHPYFAINIVGFIKAADLGALKSMDATESHQACMFRLFEDSGTIVVNEPVRSALSHIQHLRFQRFV